MPRQFCTTSESVRLTGRVFHPWFFTRFRCPRRAPVLAWQLLRGMGDAGVPPIKRLLSRSKVRCVGAIYLTLATGVALVALASVKGGGFL